MYATTQGRELAGFGQTVRPKDVRVYGKLSAEAAEWVRRSGAVSKTFEEHLAGFVRRTFE